MPHSKNLKRYINTNTDIVSVQEREDKVQHHKYIVTIGIILALVFSSFSLFITSEAKTPFAPQIRIQPTAQEVTVGETFQIDIYVDAMDNRLRGVTIDLTYTFSILHVKNITPGPLFGSSAIIIPRSGDDGAGNIHYTVLTSKSLSSSKGVFLTIDFLVIGGIPGSLHLLKLHGALYHWNYQKIAGTQIKSGLFTIGQPDYDESFISISLSGFDSNGDSHDDAVQAHMDVGTTGGVMDVSAQGIILDPRGNKDDETWVSWSIMGSTPETGTLYLYGDGPEGWFHVTLNLFDTLNHREDSWTGTIYLYPLILPITHINATPSTWTVQPGESFSLAVTITPGRALAGIQLSITFNPSFLAVTGLEEGDLFNGCTRYFNPGIIDNLNGTLTQIYATAITGHVTQPGTFIIVNVTAKNFRGVITFSIMDTLVVDPIGIESPVVIQNASILVETIPGYDLNGDTHINILDLVLVVSQWGETGTPGWIVEDFNTDGVIDCLDVLLLADHWTG